MAESDFTHFKNPAHDYKEFLNLVNRNSKKRLSFGVSYLDDSLHGILPFDLVILAAGSGAGKTELATQVSLHNANSGKNVLHYALEEFRGTPQARMAFKKMADKFYSRGDYRYTNERPNYDAWVSGLQQKLMASYVEESIAEIEAMKNLIIVGREKWFSVDELRKDLHTKGAWVDLVVIDHLHYFDTNEENENKAFKEIIRQITGLIHEFQKPVVLISHIRKENSRFAPIAPDLESIHGSSEIFKHATKVVTIAAAGNEFAPDQDRKFRFPTFIRTVKNRFGGSKKNYCSLNIFNIKTNSYEKGYQVGVLKDQGKTWAQCEPFDVPEWAKGAK